MNLNSPPCVFSSLPYEKKRWYAGRVLRLYKRYDVLAAAREYYLRRPSIRKAKLIQIARILGVSDVGRRDTLDL